MRRTAQEQSWSAFSTSTVALKWSRVARSMRGKSRRGSLCAKMRTVTPEAEHAGQMGASGRIFDDGVCSDTMQPEHGGRVELRLVGVDESQARYEVVLLDPGARWSSEAAVRGERSLELGA